MAVTSKIKPASIIGEVIIQDFWPTQRETFRPVQPGCHRRLAGLGTIALEIIL
jgi:hypothetical protein